MPCELKESFISEKYPQEINKTLLEIIRMKNGKILSCSQNYLKTKFGSMIMTRLFGVYIISNYFRNQLPFKMEIKIEPTGNSNRINLYFLDNLGKFLYRDSWTQIIYNKHFNELLKEFKEKL